MKFNGRDYKYNQFFLPFRSKPEAKIKTGSKFVFRGSIVNSCKRCRNVGVNWPIFESISRFYEHSFHKEFKSIAQDKLKIQLKTLLDFFIICIIELLKKKGWFESRK
jgi:hypothetical protein